MVPLRGSHDDLYWEKDSGFLIDQYKTTVAQTSEGNFEFLSFICYLLGLYKKISPINIFLNNIPN